MYWGSGWWIGEEGDEREKERERKKRLYLRGSMRASAGKSRPPIVFFALLLLRFFPSAALYRRHADVRFIAPYSFAGFRTRESRYYNIKKFRIRN